jgi:hypothetical protein
MEPPLSDNVQIPRDITRTVKRDLTTLTNYSRKFIDQSQRPKPAEFHVLSRMYVIVWELERPVDNDKYVFVFGHRDKVTVLRYDCLISRKILDSMAVDILKDGRWTKVV